MKTPQQRGKEFETKVQRAYEKLQATKELVCLRLYDTRSAGNYLPAQPGDFIIVYKGVPILLEVKSSEKFDTLSGKRAPLTSLFDAEQVAKMRLWRRAGAYPIVLFQSQVTGWMEVWDGDYVAVCYATPRRCIERTDSYFTFLKDEFNSCLDYILWSVVDSVA